MAHPDLIGTAVTAQILNRSIRTVHRMVADGRLKPAMTGPGGPHGSWLFDRAEIEALAVEAVA